MKEMKCPECGARGDDLDWRVVGEMKDGIVAWECFECEHEWEEKRN